MNISSVPIMFDRKLVPEVLRDALSALITGDHQEAERKLERIKVILPQKNHGHPKKEQQIQIFRQDKYTCRYCNIPVIFPPVLRLLSMKFGSLLPRGKEAWHDSHPAYWNSYASCDHVIPLARNGMDKPDNLVTACTRCQYQKGNWLLEELKCWELKPRVERGWDGLEGAFFQAVKTRVDLPRVLNDWKRIIQKLPPDGISHV